VDGVGNIGGAVPLTINITSVSIQQTDFYCANVLGNCNINYPVKKYYNSSEQIELAINFSNPSYGFNNDTSGCTIKAENSTDIVILGQINLTAIDDEAICMGNVSIGSLGRGAYLLTAEVTDANGQPAISGEDPWKNGHTKPRLWLCDYIKTPNGWTCKIDTELYGNSPPSRTHLSSPENGSATNLTKPQFNWTLVTDSDGDNVTYFLELSNESSFALINITANTTKNSYNLTQNLTEGSWYWRVRSCDNSSAPNNCSYSYGEYVLNVDFSPPVIYLESPLNNSEWNLSSLVTFRYNVTELIGVRNCSLYIDNNLNITNTTVYSNISMNFTVSLANGYHNWSIDCYDLAGNRNTSDQYMIFVDYDNEPPQISLLDPLNNSWRSSNSTTFSFRVTDKSSIDNCSLVLDGNINKTLTGISYGQNNISANISQGSYNWTINCTDELGYVGTNESEYSLYVDYLGPSFHISSPTDDYNSSISSVMFNWTMIDDSANISCNLTIDGKLNLSYINLTSGQSVNITISNFTIGTHPWNLSCVDYANNTNISQTYNFTVIDAPLGVVLSMNKDNLSIDINWTNTYADSYNIYITDDYSSGFGTTPNVTGITTLNWTDKSASERTKRFYRIASVKGNAIKHSPLIGAKYDAETEYEPGLYTDWHLLSIPVNISTWELYNGSNAGYDFATRPDTRLVAIWSYNNSDAGNEWHKMSYIDGEWIPDLDDRNFTSLELGRSYWFEINKSCNITFLGLVEQHNKTIYLNNNWNLAGWYSVVSADLGDDTIENPIYVQPPDSVDTIDRYNSDINEFEVTVHYAGWGWWPSWNNPGFTTIDPTVGYYFEANQVCEWEHYPKT